MSDNVGIRRLLVVFAPLIWLLNRLQSGGRFALVVLLLSAPLLYVAYLQYSGASA